MRRHDTLLYYVTCAQKLTGSQQNLVHEAEEQNSTFKKQTENR